MRTGKPIYFGLNTFHGTLALILDNLTNTFSGDLLTLAILDLFATQANITVDLSQLWNKSLNAPSICHFILSCAKGHQVEATNIISNSLTKMAQASLNDCDDISARSTLLVIMRRMISALDADRYNKVPTLKPKLVSNAGHSRSSTPQDDKSHVIQGSKGQAEARKLCRQMLELAMETATKGPPAHFRIDLCRSDAGHSSSHDQFPYPQRTSSLQDSRTESGTQPSKQWESRVASHDSVRKSLEVTHQQMDISIRHSNDHLLPDAKSQMPQKSPMAHRMDNDTDGNEHGVVDDSDEEDDDEDDEEDGIEDDDEDGIERDKISFNNRTIKGKQDNRKPRDYTLCSLQRCGFCGQCSH